MGIAFAAWTMERKGKEMKKLCAVLLVFLLILLSSCARNVPLEDSTIALLLGIDLDEENHFLVSESSPVFNKVAKKPIETYELKAKTIRDSRKYFDALEMGEITAAKIQVLLVGKRIIEHANWFPVLDTIYRNPQFSMNTKVFMVDGPVNEIMFFEPKAKPQLPLHLKEVIDNSIKRSRTVDATVQNLHREIYEKGITPAISKIKKDDDLKLDGVVLLDKKGKFVDSLGIEETSYLIVLRNEMREELTFSLELPLKEEEIFHKNEISLEVMRIHNKVKTKYADGKFHFDFNIKMIVDVAEKLFYGEDVKKEKLEKMIAEQLKLNIEKLIKKFQEKEVDPIGLGLYARAFYYDQYKKVEDNWPETFANSHINVKVQIKIKSQGAIDK